MSSTKKLRNAFHKHFEPFMAGQGFICRHPNFTRKLENQLHVLSVVYDKWGGGFVLEFARLPRGDLHTSWGDVVAEDNIDVAYAAQRARLVSSRVHQGMREAFFRYEHIAADQARCDALVRGVIDLFPQIEAWLVTGAVGPNVAPFSLAGDAE